MEDGGDQFIHLRHRLLHRGEDRPARLRNPGVGSVPGLGVDAKEIRPLSQGLLHGRWYGRLDLHRHTIGMHANDGERLRVVPVLVRGDQPPGSRGVGDAHTLRRRATDDVGREVGPRAHRTCRRQYGEQSGHPRLLPVVRPELDLHRRPVRVVVLVVDLLLIDGGIERRQFAQRRHALHDDRVHAVLVVVWVDQTGVVDRRDDGRLAVLQRRRRDVELTPDLATQEHLVGDLFPEGHLPPHGEQFVDVGDHSLERAFDLPDPVALVGAL